MNSVACTDNVKFAVLVGVMDKLPTFQLRTSTEVAPGEAMKEFVPSLSLTPMGVPLTSTDAKVVVLPAATNCPSEGMIVPSAIALPLAPAIAPCDQLTVGVATCGPTRRIGTAVAASRGPVRQLYAPRSVLSML